ncbi:hypothetical protein EJB05_03805, partial [Eragrostis curvula]
LQQARKGKAQPNTDQPINVIARGSKWAKTPLEEEPWSGLNPSSDFPRRRPSPSPPSNEAAMSAVGGTADFFYREAQRLGYVARSAFKLIQIQKQHRIITPGAAVLDLGCAPGAWLQVACQNLGPLEKGGVVVGVDVKKVKVPSAHCDWRVRTFCADVMTLMKRQARAMSPQERGFSVILSDMCPPVSGITPKDEAISCELGMRALSLAIGKIKVKKESDYSEILEKYQSSTEPDPDDNGVLRRGGSLVIKFLENEDVPGFGKFCKEKFKKVSLLRPKATRSSSREIYMICEGLR